MWKKLQEIPLLHISFTQNNGYEILVSDYINIWAVNFSETGFIKCLKESNEGLLLENDDLFLQKGIQMLSNPESLRRLQTNQEDNGKILKVSMTMSFGFSFRLLFKLAAESREFYFHYVTQPLMKTIQDLHSSQNELRKLLKEKDNEIDEYKCEGSVIALRHLRTPRFNDEEHMSQHKVYDENFGSNLSKDINTILKNKHEVPISSFNKNKAEESIVKHEPSAITKMELNCTFKTEPELQVTSETQNATVTNNIIIKKEINTESQVSIADYSQTHKKKQKKSFNY